MIVLHRNELVCSWESWTAS